MSAPMPELEVPVAVEAPAAVPADVPVVDLVFDPNGAALVAPAEALDADGLLDADRFPAVEATLVGREDWGALVRLYALAAERSGDPGVGRRMLLSAGLLYLEKLQDLRRAEPFFRKVLASDPYDVDALESLVRLSVAGLSVAGGRAEEAADLLDQLIALVADEEKPELLVTLADLAYGQLKATDRALVALRVAFEHDPSRLDVLVTARAIFVAVERWADANGVHDAEARAILERAGVGEGEAAGAARSPDVSAVAEAYRQLGVRLLDHALHHRLAEACLERARALGDGGALSCLDELAHLRTGWAAKAEALRDQAFEARDKKKAAQLYLAAAELYHEYGKDPIRADEYLDRCLLLAPGFVPAVRFIEVTYGEQGRHADLGRRLNAMVAAVKDPAVKAELLLRVAHLAEAQLAAAGEAADPQLFEEIVGAYRRALAIQPGHREAVARVSAILAELGRHADQAQVLEAHLPAISDEYARVQVHLELGRIYAELLGDSARARAHFEAVLTVSPGHFFAASALRALYKDAHEEPLLLRVLEVLVDYTPDFFSRLSMLHELAQVAEAVSREDAFAALRQIFILDPGASGVPEKLEALAGALGRWHALADAYAAAAATRSGPRAAGLWTAAARIYDTRLPRPKEAVAAYKQALALEPGDPEIHQALERLLRQQDDPAALVEVLRQQLSQAADAQRETLLLAKIGDVLARDLDDVAGAIEMFEQVQARDPKNATALANLDDLYRRAERFADQATVLQEREALAESPADAAELAVRRARLLDQHLGLDLEAAELYLEVLGRQPDHSEVMPALLGLLERGVSRLTIAKAVEPLLGQRGQHRKQLDALAVLVAEEPDPKRRRDYARRAAQLAEARLEDPHAALAHQGVVVELQPESEEAVEGLLRLATLTGEHRAAAGVLEGILARPDLRPEVISSLASALAEIHELHLEDPAGAVEHYRRALAADGTNAGAVAALERILGAQQRWAELAALLEERAEKSADAKARVQLGLALAALRDQRLGDLDGAVGAYRAALAVDPKEPIALARLAEALERQGRWRELVSVLDRMRDASSDPDLQAVTEVKAADVSRLRLEDRRDALERYRRALELRPGSEGAVRGLETLLESHELRAQAGALLEPHYEGAGRWRDLVLALESQLGAATGAERRRALYFRIAEIEEARLEQADGAFETLSRAFREGLLTAAEWAVLERLALRANRPKELAQTFEDALEAQPENVELLRALARLYDGAAADSTQARRAWEQLLGRVARDGEALAALERLTAAGDDPAALAQVLVARAEAATQIAERVAFLKRASAIYEEAASDLERALSTLERARDADPSDRSTWQELQRLYGRAGRSADVRDALAAEARLVDEPLQRAEVQVKLASCLVERGELEAAIAAHEGALRAVPEHATARQGLEGLLQGPAGAKAAVALEPVYRAAGDWARLVEAYEILAAATPDARERVERLVAIRSIYEERLGKLDRAFGAAARAFREAPENEQLLQALERLGRLSGAVEELIALMEDLAETLPFLGEERSKVRLRVASYAETLLRDRGRAVEAYRRALEERPDNLPALEALERLHTRGGEARELVEVLRAMAGVLEDPAQRASRLRQAARILEDKLGDRAGAAQLYEQVLMLSPGERQALARLDAIYRELKAHPELARVLTQEAAASDGQERAAFLLRLGQLERGPLQNPRAALAAFAAVLADPAAGSAAVDGALAATSELMQAAKSHHPELAAEAASLAEPHWIQRGAFVELVTGKEARIAVATDPAARRALLLEVGAIYEGSLKDPGMAFLALTRAYGEHPNDVELADALERLAEAGELEEELAELYAQVLPSIDGDALALRLARRAAHAYDVALGRGDLAVPFYNRVLASAPEDRAALEALERIHRRAGNAEALVEVYRGMLRLAEGDGAREKALWAEIARLCEDELEDDDAAFEAYRAMLALDPEDVATLKRLAALSDRSGRIQDLGAALEREAQLAKRPEERAQVLLRLGLLRRDRLNDRPAAVEAFAAALAARKDDPGAIAGLAGILRDGGEGRAEAARALAPVYAASGAFEELIGCLEVQAIASGAAAERKALFVQIAEIYEQRLGRPEHAFTYGQRALHEDVADAEVQARVERLAAAHQLMEDLAGFYLDEVEQVEDHDLALALRRRAAEIYDQALRDVPRAIAEYNRILDVAPGDAAALSALGRLYREAGSFGALADVYRRRIAQTDDREARIRLLREFSRLQGDALEDAPGAIATLRRLLDLEPNDVDALARLAELCAEQGRASEQADVLDRLIHAAEVGSKVQLDAKYRLGRLEAERLGDLGRSQRLFEEVLEADPSHPGTRELLEERFQDAVADESAVVALATGELLAKAMRAAGQWQPLIAVLRVLSRLAPSAFDRLAWDRETAAVYRDRLKQPELAFGTLSQVFAEAPGIAEVQAELEALAAELESHEELVEVLEAGLPKLHDAEAALQVERRLAQLHEQELGDRDAAATAWQRVLVRAPGDGEALEALDRLNLALGRWAALADVLERRAELAQDPKERHQLYVRLGATWDERLSERAEAIASYQKARSILADDRETLLALSRLLDPSEAPEALTEVLNALLAQTADARVKLRILVRLGEIAQGPLGRPREAIDHWRQVLALDGEHQAALEALEQLYEAEALWFELAELLDKRLGRARDEREVVRLQRKLGLVKGTRLGSVDEAVRSWTEILKRNPNDLEALQALAATYREAKRWEELIATLRKLIPLQADPQGVKSIRFELAEIYLSHLGQRDEAIESAKRVLDVEPHTVGELMRLEELFLATGAHGEAVRVMNERAEMAELPGEKVEILFDIAQIYEQKIHRRAGAAAAYEKILALEPTSAKAFDALGALYQANGDYRKLVELTNRRLDITEQAEDRRRLLFSIVDIQERWLGQPELAFTAACRAFGEEGADAQAQALAERLAEATDNWEILAEVYEEQAESAGVTRGIELRRRLGELCIEKLDEPDRAERQLEMVLAARPEDEVARGLLVGLLERQGRWRDLIAQLNDEVELSAEVEDKKRLFRRIAEIQERELGDVEGAISSIRRILDVEPEDQRALLELVRILRAAAKWQPLLNVLSRRLELAEEGAQRVAIRFEIAGVWETGLESPGEAIEAFRDVLALDESHLPSLKALERLYTQEERWSELVDVYERQVQLAGDQADALRLLTRVAGIWEEQFRDLEGAARTYIRILELDPEHRPSVKALERVWRESRDWEHLIEAYERHLELAEDRQERVGLYLSIGEVELRELGRVDRAEEAYKAALAIEPATREAVHALAQLHERHGNWFNALEMLSKEVALVSVPREAVEIYYRMGRINEEMLMDRPAAKHAYVRALEIDASHTPSLRALRTVREGEGDFAEVANLLAQEAEATAEGEERAELFFGAAEVAIEQFDDEERATRLYERALEASPQHVPSLRALSDLYFGVERWDGAQGLLSRLGERLDRAFDQQELCRIEYRLAYIAEKLGNDHGALTHYLASYELDATYLPTLEGLAAALLRAERWEDAQRVFQTILIQHRSSLTDAEVVDLYFQLGELAVRLEQLDRAKKSFQKALDLDPEHAPTLRAFARLSEQIEEWEEAYDLRDRLIALLDGDDRFEELLEQARLCEDRIGEPYRAIDAYAEARRLRPDDEAVLRPLVHLFLETSQVPRAVEAQADLVNVSPDGPARRDALMELARLQHELERDPAAAVASLNQALDLDPMCIAAFQRIEQILYQERDWGALEQNYHRMIKRLPKEQVKARLVLWRSLGDLYRKVMRNEDGARLAYEVVLKLEPEDRAVALELAALYGSKRETAAKALELYHRLLPQADDPGAVARKLFELYHALGRIDRAFCALGALVLMRAATEDELKAYALLLKRAPAGPSRALNDALWRSHVLHPDARSSVADILSVLYRGAPQLFGLRQQELQLKKKEKVELTATRDPRVKLRYFDVVQRLQQAMAVGEMEHYLRPGIGHAPRLYPGAPPVLYAGEGHEAFKTMPTRQIAWTLARQMASGRPELAAVRAFAPEAPDEAGAAVEAAIQLFLPEGSGVDLGLDPRSVQAWKRELPRALSERALKALRDPVAACIEKRDMKRLALFLDGAEHTASRAALLMAGDVAAAERGLGDADQLVTLSLRKRIRALMLFTLSPEHFELRERLGLAITA